MKRRIFKYYMFLISAFIIIGGLFTSMYTRNYYIDEVKNNLANIAFSLEYYLKAQDNLGTFNYNSLAKKYSQFQNEEKKGLSLEDEIRITFINYQGYVFGDSETNYADMENHIDRPEVQQALKHSIGSDIRHSKTINKDLLYVAVLQKDLKIITRISIPLSELNMINRLIFLYTILTIIIAILLAAIISLKISSYIAKPLNEMLVISKKISVGHFSERISIKSKDELGQLSNNFNLIAATLEQTIKDTHNKKIEFESILNSITIGIIAVNFENKLILINPAAIKYFNIIDTEKIIGKNILEIAGNHRMYELLGETLITNRPHDEDLHLSEDLTIKLSTCPIKSYSLNADNSGAIAFIQDVTKIRKLEQIKTEFVSNVTHELKTPITSIRGFIETLKHGLVKDKNTEQRFLDIIDIEAERLYSLITDVLHLSEIETSQNDTNIQKIDLLAVVNEVIEVTQHLSKDKNVEVENCIQGSIYLYANRDRIKQVLINLIDNGIKYNRQNGFVKVYARASIGIVTITIKDNGIGIPSIHLPRVFERFYRVNKGRSRDLGGTGLGLSIVKHIVNLYNGDIKVRSKENECTEFIIQFPQM